MQQPEKLYQNSGIDSNGNVWHLYSLLLGKSAVFLKVRNNIQSVLSGLVCTGIHTGADRKRSSAGNGADLFLPWKQGIL